MQVSEAANSKLVLLSPPGEVFCIFRFSFEMGIFSSDLNININSDTWPVMYEPPVRVVSCLSLNDI